MVFSRFFKKDPSTLADKGEKCLRNGDYSRACQEFSAALELLGPDAASDPVAQLCREGRDRAMNALAEANLEEARHHLRLGNAAKAREHLELAQSQATDEALSARITSELASSPATQPATPSSAKAHSCSGCGTHGHGDGHDEEASDDQFSGDRFELLIAALPGDLPQRYAAMGDDFARAYVLADEERFDEALPILGAIPGAFDNDIVLYEMAVIYHRQGRIQECDALFRRVLGLNRDNPIANLAFFHLLAETGRYQEGVVHLQGMLDRDILPDQAAFMLADLKQAMGEEEEAMKLFTEVLKTRLASEAAKRLVPLLQKQGKEREAKQLAKQYLKGCC